jgi:predicted RNase H-like HicB family nuclease
MRYEILIEKVGGNFSAYVPDLAGCWLRARQLPQRSRRFVKL